jgi:hypothetical protein
MHDRASWRHSRIGATLAQPDRRRFHHVPLLGALLGGAATKMPKIETPAPPAPDDAAVEEARRKEVIAGASAKGRAGTYLTGASGDTTTPELRKRFLGD